MLASAYDGVVFDCDGVLVDSEPITNRLLATMVGELGVPISVETAHRMFVGRSFADDVIEIEKLIGKDPGEKSLRGPGFENFPDLGIAIGGEIDLGRPEDRCHAGIDCP